jgi:hypothetical protein
MKPARGVRQLLLASDGPTAMPDRTSTAVDDRKSPPLPMEPTPKEPGRAAALNRRRRARQSTTGALFLCIFVGSCSSAHDIADGAGGAVSGGTGGQGGAGDTACLGSDSCVTSCAGGRAALPSCNDAGQFQCPTNFVPLSTCPAGSCARADMVCCDELTGAVNPAPCKPDGFQDACPAETHPRLDGMCIPTGVTTNDSCFDLEASSCSLLGQECSVGYTFCFCQPVAAGLAWSCTTSPP